MAANSLVQVIDSSTKVVVPSGSFFTDELNAAAASATAAAGSATSAETAAATAIANADDAVAARIGSETAESGAVAAELGAIAAITDAGGSLGSVILEAANRTILAALSTSLGLSAYLEEPHREGPFVWGGTNRSSAIQGAKATGTLTLTANPAANDTVTINGTVITFVASGATGMQVNIGASNTATAASLVALINANPATFACTAAAPSNVVTLTASVAGYVGGPIALAKNSTAITASGLFLNGAVPGDPQQGTYVAPASDPTGASGAWARPINRVKYPGEFGATGDGSTDDYVALQAMLDSGGQMAFPPGKARSSAALIVRRCVRLTGASYGFDGRIVGYSNMPGSKIAFDAGVGGFDIQPQWTNTDWPSGTPTQEGAMHSVIENIGLIGAGGAAATGIHCRTIVHLRNLRVIQFSGRGFDISAGASSGPYGESGNADQSVLESCHALLNGSDGFCLQGVDANVIKLDTCNAQSNGGWGFLDEASFANLYLNCHTTVNTLGCYKAIGQVANHSFVNCYVEGGTGDNCDISHPSVVVGGNLSGQASAASGKNAHSVGSYPNIINGDGYSTLRAQHVVGNLWNAGAGIMSASDAGCYGGSTAYGFVQQGRGATGDVAWANQSGAIAAYIETNSLNLKVLGRVSANSVRRTALTVATLPSPAVVGDTAFVTDSTANTFGTVVAGGGSFAVPVHYDGSWRIG